MHVIRTQKWPGSQDLFLAPPLIMWQGLGVKGRGAGLWVVLVMSGPPGWTRLGPQCVCEGTETDRNKMTSLQAHSVAGGGVGFIPRWVCPEASVPNSGDVAGRASFSSTTLSSCPWWAWKAGCGHPWWKQGEEPSLRHGFCHSFSHIFSQSVTAQSVTAQSVIHSLSQSVTPQSIVHSLSQPFTP